MGNHTIIGHNTNTLTGTIPASGTLTHEIDLMEYSIIGLLCPAGFSPGTLSFQASPTSDFSDTGGQYVDIKSVAGSNVQIGGVSGGFALRADDLSFLSAYRYVKIKSSVSQGSVVTFHLPVKA